MGQYWHTCPVYDGCPYTRECQPLTQQQEAIFSGGLMTIPVGLSLHRRAHQLQFVVDTSQVSSSHLSLIFLFPFQASAFTSTRSPGFKFTNTYFSVIVPFLLACFHGLLGLCLLQGTPHSVYHRSYIHIHTPGGGLSSWGPHSCQWWGRQSQLGA